MLNLKSVERNYAIPPAGLEQISCTPVAPQKDKAHIEGNAKSRRLKKLTCNGT